MDTSNYSLSDLAAVSGNEGGFGGNGAWWIIILFLFVFMGGGGMFGNSTKEQYATTQGVQDQFNFAALERQNNETIAAVHDAQLQTVSATKDLAYTNLTGIRDVQSAIALNSAEQAQCCCNQLRAIDSVNYNAAQNTCSINTTTVEQTQKILDAIAGNRMADMQNQINQLQLQASLCGVVRYPNATTYSAGYNPLYDGCGCGCSGTTF